jgi:hypothetical protein
MVLRGKLIAEGALSALLDGTIRAVELRCAGLPEAAFERLRAGARDGVRGPADWSFTFADLDAAGRAAQEVLAQGGRLMALQPVRENLEETFVRLASAEPVAGAARDAA